MFCRHFLALSMTCLLASPGAPVLAAPLHPNEVTAILFLPGDQTLLYAASDNLHVWDLPQGKERLQFAAHTNGCYGLSLSHDGKWFASAGGDRLVRLWDVRTLKELRTFEGHRKEVVDVAFSPDGRLLAAGGYDGSVRIWETATGTELHVLRGHAHRVTSVAFSPDGKLLATGGIVPFETENFKGSTQGDFVRLWDPKLGKEMKRLPVRGQRIAFTPDGKYLLAGTMYLELNGQQQGRLIIGAGTFDGGSRTVVWDLDAGKERLRLKEYYPGLALAADGKVFATGWGSRLHGGGVVLTHRSPNRGLHLWELSTGRELGSKAVSEQKATVIAFSPDGKRIAFGGVDGELQFWTLPSPGSGDQLR